MHRYTNFVNVCFKQVIQFFTYVIELKFEIRYLNYMTKASDTLALLYLYV